MKALWELEFMRLAAVAGVAAAVALSTLGVYVVLKRVVFVGLALANLATLGAAVALAVGLPVEATAIVATLGGAAALALAATPRVIPSEAIIGWGFAAASGLTVLVLARSTTADAEAMRLLFGNVLAISAGEAAMMAVVASAVLLIHGLFARRFVLVVFDPLAARAAGIHTALWTLILYLTVGGAAAAAVHETGALLAFALLVLPAMAALLISGRLMTAFLISAAIAVTCVVAGLGLSFHWDLPTGPLTVALLAAAVPLAALARRALR